MLSDFLTLEVYFGAAESALFFEDLVQHYGPETIKSALKAGDIDCRTVHIGPDEGRTIYGLSPQGRAKISSS